MEPPSTNSDDYIRVGRLSLFVSLFLLAGGVFLVAWGVDPDESLVRELGGQLGIAFVTTAIIDLLLLRGIESWKRAVAAPFVRLAESMLKTDAAMEKILVDTEKVVREVKEDAHRDQVEMNLELIRNELEAIRFAVDPSYRELLKMIDNNKTSEEPTPVKAPPNSASTADA